MSWDRIQRIELDLAQARHRIVKLEDELIAMGLDYASAMGSVARLTEERDTARAFAIHLEGEASARDAGIARVPYWGTAT